MICYGSPFLLHLSSKHYLLYWSCDIMTEETVPFTSLSYRCHNYFTNFVIHCERPYCPFDGNIRAQLGPTLAFKVWTVFPSASVLLCPMLSSLNWGPSTEPWYTSLSSNLFLFPPDCWSTPYPSYSRSVFSMSTKNLERDRYSAIFLKPVMEYSPERQEKERN